MRGWSKLVYLLSFAIVAGGCQPSAEKSKTQNPPQEAGPSLKSMVEEESPRRIAAALGWSCETLSKIRIESKKIGMKELYDFLQKECRGEEPSLPIKLPAQCVDQIPVQKKNPVAMGPGMDIPTKDVLKHNLERCQCPPEYKLLEKESQPYCQRNVALPQPPMNN